MISTVRGGTIETTLMFGALWDPHTTRSLDCHFPETRATFDLPCKKVHQLIAVQDVQTLKGCSRNKHNTKPHHTSFLMISSSLPEQIDAARQKAQILYAEVRKANTLIRNATLALASSQVAPIPPERYLRLHKTLKGHRDKIAQVKWSRDLVHLVSACQDGFMIVWDTVTALKVQAIPLANSWVLLCAYLPSGRFVALAGLDNRCTIYRVNDKTENAPNDSYELQNRGPYRTVARAHAAYISACEFISDSRVLTASGDTTVALWDVTKGIKVREFVDHLGDVLALLVNSSDTFVSAGADGYVKVWDSRVKAPVNSCFISNTDVNTVAQLPDACSFVAGADDGACKLYDLRADCELATYSLKNQFSNKQPSSPTSVSSMWSTFDTPGVVSVDVSVLGRVLYVCYADYGCIAWDTLKNQIIESIGVGSGSHTGRISNVCVSPDGQGLATASWDSTIKVWST